jgi:hypothetical protein
MASGGAVNAYSSSASVGTVDTVWISQPANVVVVTNDSGTAPIWFTVGSPGGPDLQPTVGGANCHCAASVAGTSVKVSSDGMFGSIINLTSTGTPLYTVSIQESL